MAAPGYDMYYLNVMAGPAPERAWLASQRLGRLATVAPDGVVGNAPVTYFVRADDTIDIIVVPQIHSTESFVMTQVGEVENAWMCAPALAPKQDVLPLAEIAQYPLILQGGLSGTGFIYSRFLQEHGVSMQRILASNSLIAQIGLTLSGLGISYLPKACLNHMVTRGALGMIQTRPALPPVSYVAMHRAEQPHSLNAEIARLAAQCCDFSSNLLDPGRV